MRTLKNLAIAAAMVGLVASAQAEYYPGSTDFEGDAPLADACWSNVVEAAIEADASVSEANRSPNLPPSFNTTSRTNVLSFDTDAPIVRYLQSDWTAPSASTIYADILMKWQPCPADASVPEADDEDKILVYTRVSQSGSETNLCVYAKDSADGTAQEFVLTKTIGKDEWHRLVIKATAAGYQVYCDGTDAADLCKTADDVDTFYALSSGAPMTSVAFAGSGHVDDIILSDTDSPLPVYTLTWGEGFDSVSFTTNGVAGAALVAADDEYQFQAPEGLEVVLTGNTGYRTIEVSVTGSSSAISLEGVSGIAKYFPQTATADQDGSAEHPYEIPDLVALQALQAAVADTTNCFGLCFCQIADIAMTAAWPGIGVAAGKDLAADVYEAGAFAGIYDGGDYTISNFQMVDGVDHGALFNSIYNATVKNLKISWGASTLCTNSSDQGSDAGASFVGTAKGSTLLNLTALAGTVTTVSASKDMAGIVGYLYAGSTVDSCTNELNVASFKASGKCGGIAIISQSGTETAVIRNCENTAAVPFMHVEGAPSITVSGVNKGHAGYASNDKIGGVSGLYFATVEGNVATFVADDALALNGEYKVMSDGATATFAFTAPGTIAFDEALSVPTYAVTAADGLALTDAAVGTLKTYTAAAVPATWIGGAQGDWETPSNWDGDFVPTRDTVVTFTNDAQVAILGFDRCKELVLSNANVTLVRAANATQPMLYFYGDEGRAVSVASGATGSLAVNDISLFNRRQDSGVSTIGCAFEILGDVTFRGVNPGNDVAASFTITGKTTISADAIVKTIDHGTTKFLGSIEVAKGVRAKVTTKPHGTAQIGTGVTLIANDGAGTHTAIWLMQNEGTSRGVSLVDNAPIAVDADHAGDYYAKKRSDKEDDLSCDVYEVYQNPTVFVTTDGVTVTGVENGQRVIPSTSLVICVSDIAEGYVPSVKILKHDDYSELLITNAVSFTYTMPDFDINVVAEATSPSYNDPEGYEIGDLGLIDWLSGNGFTQGDIAALGNDAAATDKLYECWLLNCSIKSANPGGALSSTAIAVSNGVVSIAVQLDRNSPLGYIEGVLHIYGTDDFAVGFGESPISEEIVNFVDGDPIFEIEQTEGPVTQSVTATFSPDDVSATFFKTVIEFPIPGGEEEPWEELEE